MSKARTNSVDALPQQALAALAAKIIREGRMPQPGRLVDALSVRPAAGAAPGPARLSRDLAPQTVVPYHRVFASSSQRENSTANQAKAALHSPEFHNLILLSHRLPATDGGESGLGYWSDGAEESRVIHVTDPAMLDHVAARVGRAFNQKAVLHFATDAAGSDIAHVLSVPSSDADLIADKLAAHGVEFKTIVPHADEGRSDVHVIDMGGVLTPDIGRFADEMGAEHKQHIGRGSFIGAESREQAAQLFDHILSKPTQIGPTI